MWRQTDGKKTKRWKEIRAGLVAGPVWSLKARGKNLTNRRVQWQQNRKEQTLWPLLIKIRLWRKEERD